MKATFPIIGFAGIQGAGKSTAANILEKYGYKIRSFATPLKDMCRAIGIPEKNITGSLADKNEVIDIVKGRSIDDMAKSILEVINVRLGDLNSKRIELMGFTPNEAIDLMKSIGLFEADTSRKFQQLLGTEWGRKINPNFWTHLWNLHHEQHKRVKFVADDVRFPNEVDLLKFKKGVVIRLICEDEPANVGLQGHASEQSHLLKCNAGLFNFKQDRQRLENSLMELLDWMA